MKISKSLFLLIEGNKQATSNLQLEIPFATKQACYTAKKKSRKQNKTKKLKVMQLIPI